MLYRFVIELSDIDRALYTTIDFRVSQHPSEILPYLLTRVLAYALNYHEGINFAAGGLSDPEAPAIQVLGPHGAIELWIEIGNPSSRKLHKASKTAKLVRVYTYKSAEVLLNEMKNNAVHRAQEIEIFAIDSKFLQNLEKQIKKNNRWTLLHQQGQIDLDTGQQLISMSISKIQLN